MHVIFYFAHLVSFIFQRGRINATQPLCTNAGCSCKFVVTLYVVPMTSLLGRPGLPVVSVGETGTIMPPFSSLCGRRQGIFLDTDDIIAQDMISYIAKI